MYPVVVSVRYGDRRRRLLFLFVASAFLSTCAMIFIAGCGRRNPDRPTAPAAPIATVEGTKYAGDAACAPCHADISRQHSASAHAATLRLVTEQTYGPFFRSSQQFHDTIADSAYSLGVQNHRCVLITKGTDGITTTPAELAVGSGRNGVTFLGHVDPFTWAVLRLSYYATQKAWLYTPGQKPEDHGPGSPAGKELAAEEVAMCIRCHVTDLQRANGDLDLGRSHLGVGCEACHGPGRSHVESAKAAAAGGHTRIVPMELLTSDRPARIEALCRPCHSTTSDTSHGGAGSELKLVRFQATALESSRCFRESRSLTCVTCHDPHTDIVQNRAAEEAVCLRCHSPAPSSAHPAVGGVSNGRVCKIDPRHGCIECHMPASLLPDVPSHPFHNHWIKVWPQRGHTAKAGPDKLGTGI